MVLQDTDFALFSNDTRDTLAFAVVKHRSCSVSSDVGPCPISATPYRQGSLLFCKAGRSPYRTHAKDVPPKGTSTCSPAYAHAS